MHTDLSEIKYSNKRLKMFQVVKIEVKIHKNKFSKKC